MQSEYVVYGAGISLFTRKLEAAMRFYGAPFRIEAKGPGNAEEVDRARTHQVPVLRTPENWMIADTTPLLGLLDGRFPRRRLFPEGPLGVLVHVVEEILDEWYARVMVHYRWHYMENTRYVVGKLLGREVSEKEARSFPLAQWGPRACRATGTESPNQQKEVEREYHELLGVLETQLGTTRYALGDRPTAADAILLGGLRAHTNGDPIPDLKVFERVIAWDEREADRWDGGGELAPFPESTPSRPTCCASDATATPTSCSATQGRSRPGRRPSSWRPTARRSATCADPTRSSPGACCRHASATGCATTSARRSRAGSKTSASPAASCPDRVARP